MKRTSADVTTDGADTKTASLPPEVHADLTSNPKQFENFPNLNSHLDGVVTADGKFIVKDFQLGSQKKRALESLDNKLSPDGQDLEERYYGPNSKP